MVVIELDNGWVVKPFCGGLSVYDNDDELLCMLDGVSMNDFEDEWGNIDEDELEAAIREEINTACLVEELHQQDLETQDSMRLI